MPGGGAGGIPGGTGAATMPGPMGGSGAAAMTGVKVGVEALQNALPKLPMGSKLHTAILKAITDIAKEMDQGMGNDPAAIIQQLTSMARNAQTDPRRAALMSMSSPGGAGGGAPPPPMGGGAPPPMMGGGA